MEVAHLPVSQHCFCQIPFEELARWFYQHYELGIPTLTLMASARNDTEREAITAVALFELDDASVLRLMGDVNLPEHHILHCRELFRARLRSCLANTGEAGRHHGRLSVWSGWRSVLDKLFRWKKKG